MASLRNPEASYSTPIGPPPSNSIGSRLNNNKYCIVSEGSFSSINPGSSPSSSSPIPSPSSSPLSSTSSSSSAAADQKSGSDSESMGENTDSNEPKKGRRAKTPHFKVTKFKKQYDAGTGCVYDYEWDRTSADMSAEVFEKACEILTDGQIAGGGILTKLYLFLYKKKYIYVYLNQHKKNDYFKTDGEQSSKLLESSAKLDTIVDGVNSKYLRMFFITLLFNNEVNEFRQELGEKELLVIEALKALFHDKQGMMEIKAKHKAFLKNIYMHSKHYKLVRDPEFLHQCEVNSRNKYLWIKLNNKDAGYQAFERVATEFNQIFERKNQTRDSQILRVNDENQKSIQEKGKTEGQHNSIKNNSKSITNKNPPQKALPSNSSSLKTDSICPDIVGWSLCDDSNKDGWKDILVINIMIARLSVADSNALETRIKNAILDFVNNNYRMQEGIKIDYQLQETFIITPPFDFSTSLQINNFHNAALLSEEKIQEWKEKGFPSVINGLETENTDRTLQYCSWQNNHTKLPCIRIIIPVSLLCISDIHDDGQIWVQYDVAWGFTIIIKKKRALTLAKITISSSIGSGALKASAKLFSNNSRYWDYEAPIRNTNIDKNNCDICMQAGWTVLSSSLVTNDHEERKERKKYATYTGCEYCARLFCKKCVKGFRDCHITKNKEETDALWVAYFTLEEIPDVFVCPRCIYCHAVSCSYETVGNRKQRSLRPSDPTCTKRGTYGTCDACNISYHECCTRKYPKCRYCGAAITIKSDSEMPNEEIADDMQIDSLVPSEIIADKKEEKGKKRPRSSIEPASKKKSPQASSSSAEKNSSEDFNKVEVRKSARGVRVSAIR